MGEPILISTPGDENVVGLLDQLACETGVLEDFVVWIVEDMKPHPVAMELRALRRAIDAGTAEEAAMGESVRQLAGAAIAAGTTGLGRARDPRAATMLAAMQLIHRGEHAIHAAKQCSRLHALHDRLSSARDASPTEVARAASGAYTRQLGWLIACVEGGGAPAPRHGERYLFGDAPFDPSAVVEVLADARLAGPPEEQPRAAIVMGRPGAGKTTHRLQKHPGRVAIDASDIYLHLCSDKKAPFPGMTLRRMTEVGYLLVRRALTARKSIVLEVIGADLASLERVVASLKGIGYGVDLELIHCAAEEATRRHEAMTENRISAFYTEGHHLAWVDGVATELSSQPHPIDEAL